MSSTASSPVRVGVVVPAYNSAAYLAHSLRSLQRQDFTSWVCVVVDDCSTDDTLRIARAIAAHEPRITIITRTVNGGVARSRNDGLAALPPETPLVTFLDSDDAYLPEALSSLTAALDARPDAFGVFGIAEYINADGEQVRPGDHPQRQRDRREWTGRRFIRLAPGTDSGFSDLIAYGPAWPPSVALLRADVVRDVGGFDPAMELREDWDLFVRLSRRAVLAMIDEQVVWYRRHDANVTKQMVVNDRQHAAVALKIFSDPDNTPPQRNLLSHLHRRQLLRTARQMVWRALVLTKAGQIKSALTIGVAALWTVLLVARSSPPRPDGVRIALSYAGYTERWPD